MAVTGSVWSPSSWRSYPPLHQPEWPSEERAEAARGKLATVPPLVFAGEARQLRAALAEVADGRAFLLQAGDCAESFNDVSAIHIREKLKILLQMAAVLTYGATLPVVKVGRIAGQYAKARTSPTEPGGDGEIPIVPRPHDPRRRSHGEGSHPGSGAHGRGLLPRDSTLTSSAHSRRAASPTSCGCTSGTRSSSPRPSRAASTSGSPPRSSARFSSWPRADRRRRRAEAPSGRRLDEPRRTGARLRGGAHAPRLDHGRLVRLLRAHALDRERTRKGSTARTSILLRRAQPAGREGRAHGNCRRATGDLRAARLRRGCPAGSRLSSGWGRSTSSSSCRRSSRRAGDRSIPSCGPATRCT